MSIDIEQVPLVTLDRLKELFSYDPETGLWERRITTTWAVSKGPVPPSKNKDGYVLFKVDYRKYAAHRLAWFYFYGRWPNGVIDHINGDRADNRIENLRDVTRQVNMQNQRRACVSNKLGLLGVSEDKSKTRITPAYKASIGVGKNRIYLGSYPTPELAHAAYVEAKRKLHEGCTI